MSVQETIDCDFGKLHRFEKSFRVDGIPETLFISDNTKRDTLNIINFLNAIYKRGRLDKAKEVRKVLL